MIHRGYQNLDAYLAKYDKFVISTHESPDWDGLGSEIAFNELLKSLGKKSIIINSDCPPDNYEFLDSDFELNVFSDTFQLPVDIDDYAQIVFDTNDYDNIGKAYSILKDRVRDLFIIDHHEGGKDKFEANFIKVEASSTCEIVYEIIKHYGKSISPKAARALYAGVLFDTGSFRYPKTSTYTFLMVSDLVSCGANPFDIYEQIYEQNSLSSFTLNSKILSTMEVLHSGKMISMKLTQDMINDTGASFNEGEKAINIPLTVKGVVASVLVKQDIGGPVKVSMRTKGDLDVAAIAMENNGGGHKNAAGFKSKLSLDETYKNVLKSMERFF
jgi:phosphoesterase RecJ-like protein